MNIIKESDFYIWTILYFYIQMILFVWLQAEFNEEQLELMKNLHNECITQTGVSEGNDIFPPRKYLLTLVLFRSYSGRR